MKRKLYKSAILFGALGVCAGVSLVVAQTLEERAAVLEKAYGARAATVQLLPVPTNENELSSLQNDLRRYYQDVAKEGGDLHLPFGELDLNGDNMPEIVVQLISAETCPDMENCRIDVLEVGQNGFRRLMTANGLRLSAVVERGARHADGILVERSVIVGSSGKPNKGEVPFVLYRVAADGTYTQVK